ncbi:MAG: nicotinamide mononucleotide transporter [Flavobacteriia bacterium]|nr:nicotinamide mononucleotide transporter [Flavobacteriia bacterium]
MDFIIDISWSEALGAILNLAFLILLIRRSVYCWPFGILGSGISIVAYIDAGLYSEAILYGFYVLIGIYGWYQWDKHSDSHKQIKPIQWGIKQHLIAIAVAFAGMLGLGWFFSDAEGVSRPYEDAFSTSFAFVASYLEAKQVLSGWIYWIVLNGFSVWLNNDRGLVAFAFLAVINTIMSVYGYYSWIKSKRKEELLNPDVLY